MQQLLLRICWAVALLLAAPMMSCVHTPAPHVHGTVNPIPQGTSFVVEGYVIDAETGASIPHAVLYLVDVRPENWEHLDQYSARLGTANRSGHIDLAINWLTTFDLAGEPKFMQGYDRLRDTEGLVTWAEGRCRGGELGSIALALVAGRYEWRYEMVDATKLKPEADGTLIIELGQIELQPRPASEYLFYETFEAASALEDAESAAEDMP